jgi:hypothetical protein
MTSAGIDTGPLAQRVLAAATLITFVALATPNLTAPTFQLSVRSEPGAQAPAGPATSPGRDVLRTPELFVAAYSGLPYTHPSDVLITRPDGSAFTTRAVDWQTKPWIDPIYYGVRIAGWSGRAPFGAMLDFTHSKTIASLENEEAFEGTKDGAPMPAKGKLGDTFKRLEFSHGHNILTVNGLYRLPFGSERVRPYIGLGLGVNIPHTEVWLASDAKRTYEYQLAGPATQGLIGVEIRLPRETSVFLEYKLSFSWYEAPITGRDGGWFFDDIWKQLSGASPPVDGVLRTNLATHQVIGGLGLRVGGRPVAGP